MEGLEASVITRAEVLLYNEVGRLDATYFLKSDVAKLHSLGALQHDKLGDVCYVTDGIHTSIDFAEGSGIKVISAKHPKNGFLDLSSVEEISEQSHRANPRTALRENDVIVSTVGTIGNAAVVRSEALPANSDRHVAILRTLQDAQRPVCQEYVSVFLNSSYGRMQSRRETTGNVQPNLFLVKIRDIKLARFSDELEDRISQLSLSSLGQHRASHDAISQAEKILLEALGLADWTPPQPLSYSARACDAFAAGRLDAQYFSPLFTEVEQRLLATGDAVELGAILDTISRGRQPEYSDEGLPVVNSKHVRTNKVLLDHNNRRAAEAGSNVVIEKGDILVNGTGVGTIGRAAAYLHGQKALPDNHVTVLRTNRIDPIYLAVFLNSPLGQLQLERHIKGSSGQIELYPNDIAKVMFWEAPQHVQTGVRNAILSAFNEERRTNELMEAAKRTVEVAIEEGEDAAMAFLDKVEG